MTPSPATYSQLEQNFVAWAGDRADIRAALVVGSRARREPPPDEWSDLDFILYAADPAVYAADPGC
jgi:aminoglycoside 6-adenylyltransferase